MLKKFIVLLIAIFITGCGTIVKTEIKEVPVYQIDELS